MVIIARSNHGADLRLLVLSWKLPENWKGWGLRQGHRQISTLTWEMNLAEPLRDIPSMAEKCVDMLHRAVALLSQRIGDGGIDSI